MKSTKDYILKKSLELFLNKSFKEVTMKEIVSHTGLSKGAFYHYFESKDAVFVEVVKYFYNDILITDYSNFPHSSLKDFYNAYIDHLQKPSDVMDNPDRKETNLYVFISEAARRIPTFSEIHTAQRNKEIDAWTNAVARARENKEIHSSLSDREIAKMFIYLSDGISLTALVENPNEQTLAELQNAWDSLYGLLIIS